MVPPRLPAEASPPVWVLSTARVLLMTVRWQVFGLLCMACHVVLVRDAGVLCFPLLLLCLLIVSRLNPLAGLMMYFQILLYQNGLVSVFSEGMTRSDYTVLSGTSFAAAVLLAGGPAFRFVRSGRAFFGGSGSARTAGVVAVAVVVAVGYAAWGAAVAGATPAAVGFRNAVAMLLAIAIGLDAGDRWSYRTVATAFVTSTVLGVGLVGLEMADPAGYLAMVNAVDFGNVKYATSEVARYFTVDNVIAQMTQSPFNTDLLSDLMPGQAYRFGGPNMHSISYGYVLAATELTLLSLGWYAPVLPLLVLSFLIGVKGAAILFCGTVLLLGVWRVTGSRRMLAGAFVALATAYVGYGIVSGLRSGDFHVIGFLGGVNGFLSNPLGHGIGVGGNLSVGSLSMAKWQAFQHGGADVGLESAVGVLLYQMGIGSLAIVAAIVSLVRAARFGVGGRAPTDVLFIGLCICLVNGIFQEEAYSPYAAGLLSLLCGVVVANGRRPLVLLGQGRPG